MTGPEVSYAGAGGWEQLLHVERVWGTAVVIDFRGPALPDDADEILRDCIAFLHQVDAWFSTYRADTPITMLRNGLIEPFRVPKVVRDVLDACAYAKRLTDGAFDPWAVPGGVDPSGYVKGWAAGRLADMVVARGIANVSINCSGDISCRGFQAPGELWAIGIQNPYDRMQVVEVVHLGDGAIATSGLYERGNHIRDPRTGRDVVHYDSATIVGPDAGLPDWSVYFIKDGVVSYFGPAFAGGSAA